jgi:magnesium-transporting ATPase (P-type)
VLAVNLVTDVLPAVSIAVQEPEHRNLALLSREGTAALDEPLRRAILRRGIATTIPAFVAYLSASRTPDLGRRRAVAFITVVGGQLAQTVDLGRAEGRLSPEVLQAVAASAAFVGAAVTFPPFQRFLGLGTPGPFGLALSAAAILASLVISRMLVADDAPNPTPHT